MDLNRAKIMVAGHICLDITPSFESDYGRATISDIFVPGKLINVGKATFSTGGDVANTGLSMHKLAVDVLLNGKIGTDSFGKIIKQLVGDELSSSLREVAHQSSSYSVVVAIAGIDRIFLHHAGSNDTFTSGDIDYARCLR